MQQRPYGLVFKKHIRYIPVLHIHCDIISICSSIAVVHHCCHSCPYTLYGGRIDCDILWS